MGCEDALTGISRRTFVKGALAAGVVAAGATAVAVVPQAQALEASDIIDGTAEDTIEVSPTCKVPDAMTAGMSHAGSDPIAPADAPDTYDEEFDCIVVGGGGAGMMAASTVAESGYKVVVLEKNGYTGGDTQFTLGITAKGCDWQLKIGEEQMAASNGAITQNPWDYYGAESMMGLLPVATTYLGSAKLGVYLENSRGLGIATPSVTFARDMHISAMICDANTEATQWLVDHGVTPALSDVAGFPAGSGLCPCDPAVQGQSDDWRSYAPYTGRGYFKDCFNPYCAELGVDVRLESPVSRLVWDGTKVTGVVYTDDAGQEHAIGAPCVVLATGGFGANQDMLDRYVEPRRAAAIRYWGQPGATGDGIRMAQGVGGATRGMNEVEIWDGGACREQGGTGGYTAANQLARQKSMSVNKVCNRYMNEGWYDGYWYTANAAHNINQPDMTVFTLFDSTMVSAADIIEKFQPEYCEYPLIDFDEKLAGYIEDGTVKKADTIAELADMLGLDPDKLQASVDRYNGFCDAGYDSDYFKDPEYLWAIKEPPFYGVAQYGGTCFATWGGLVIDEGMNVLDEAWQPIAGLYAAGEQTFGGSSGGMVMPAGRLVGHRVSDALASGATAASGSESSSGSSASAAPVVYTDGSYDATGVGLLGDVPVTVTIKDGAIASVEVGENNETWNVGGAAIDQLPALIVAANGTDGVDTISGATMTSTAIIMAVDDCLDQATSAAK